MRTILVVGKAFSDLTSYLDAHGYDWVTLRDIKTTKYPDKRMRRRIVCDFSNEAGIVAALEKLKCKPDAVIVVYENYVLPAAIIAEKLGLPGMPIRAAEACTDKYLMRSRFALAPEKISPDFAEVSCEEDLDAFADTHRFPLILKPANLMKSLLVTKAASMNELIQNYRKAMESIRAVYEKYAPNRVPKLIIEEYLEGPVHSVDAFVDAGGTPHIIEGIVDYQTGYDIGYDDNFHYSRLMPTRLTGAEQRAFLRCADLACRALGMRSSPAHIEIIVTTEGPRIVEIGARNGGYRERMYALARGIDITGNALAVALDEPVDITPNKDEPVAVLELFPKEAGTYDGIKNIGKLKELPSLYQFHEKVKLGDIVGKSSDGYKMCAMVFLHNKDCGQFARDLSFVNSSVCVLTK